ncbi:UNVERIFIED_CONTAM: Cyclin-dependent kinase G-1 [Sesamum latifolium]|uniref:Cyclin-dependent kinase G-1 n=1 Tax=Sesamum latifolium TaxID=2727402 RepID=A0AAW2UE85_9LAMI
MKEEFNGLSTSTLREIAILESLPQHPAVVEFKEVVRDDWDRVFVVMEHVENDLGRFMAVRRQPMHPNEVKCIMKQLLEGVKFLHENGVMHRDLKPSNILINKKGDLKICDFGLSRQFESRSGSYSPKGAVILSREPRYTILGRAKPDDNLFIRKFLEASIISGVPLPTGLGFDLLKKLLEYDPDKRITAEAALNHGWFKEFDPHFFLFSKQQQLAQ